jgi:hypothetical protein
MPILCEERLNHVLQKIKSGPDSMRGRNAGMTASSRDRHHSVEISLLGNAGDGNDRTAHFREPGYERDECELSITILPVLTALVHEERNRVFAILLQ